MAGGTFLWLYCISYKWSTRHLLDNTMQWYFLNNTIYLLHKVELLSKIISIYMELLDFEAELEFGRAYIVKHSQSVGTWVVEGYASTSDLDAQNHIVSPEAIAMGAESLKKYDTVLFNHDPDRPIGKIVNSEALDSKLLIKVAISKTEPKIWEQIKDGTLSKFSIRGQITDSETYEDARTFKEIRVIKGMELHEVSLVSVPANPQAKSLSWYIEKALNLKKESDEDTEKKVYRHEGESMSDCVSRKVKMNMAEGMKHAQAIATAISECKATKDMSETDIYDEIIKFLLEKKDDEDEVSPIEEAISDLQEVSQLLKGEDKDQVMSIIRSLQALLGRIGKSIEEGGQIVDIKEEVKKEVVEEEVIEKKADIKEDIKKEVSLDVSALRDVIVQLQTMVKDITSQSETVKSTLSEVTKVKDEISKMVTDLNTVVKDIPLRKGQTQEDEKEDRTKETVVTKSITDSDEFKKAKPADQLHMLISQAATAN